MQPELGALTKYAGGDYLYVSNPAETGQEVMCPWLASTAWWFVRLYATSTTGTYASGPGLAPDPEPPALAVEPIVSSNQVMYTRAASEDFSAEGWICVPWFYTAYSSTNGLNTVYANN